jgi:hypothetical protein
LLTPKGDKFLPAGTNLAMNSWRYDDWFADS